MRRRDTTRGIRKVVETILTQLHLSTHLPEDEVLGADDDGGRHGVGWSGDLLDGSEVVRDLHVRKPKKKVHVGRVNPPPFTILQRWPLPSKWIADGSKIDPSMCQTLERGLILLELTRIGRGLSDFD
jgi:hypothetical protein